jgi:hypothetical protein
MIKVTCENERRKERGERRSERISFFMAGLAF